MEIEGEFSRFSNRNKSCPQFDCQRCRENEAEVTIFKSTGMAIQDMATAKKVYELAKEKGFGLEVSITP